jgi:hypothetical protein
LNTEALRSLVRDGTSPRERTEFAYAALYLIIKGSAHNRETQIRLIQEVTRIAAECGEDAQKMRARVRGFVETEIHTRDDWAVDAHTLQGKFGKNLTILERMYHDKAEALSKDSRDVFLVGHATFLGLPYFIQAFQQHAKTLYILMPQYIAASNLDITRRNEPTGIKIENGTVRFITTEDYAKLTSAIVIDDIKSTGETERKLQEFLTQASPQAHTSFEPIMQGQNSDVAK